MAKKKTKTKKKTTTKKTKTKLTAAQSKEMLQPGARGGMITGPSNFPGYRGQ